jgi:hypothetical protein
MLGHAVVYALPGTAAHIVGTLKRNQNLAPVSHLSHVHDPGTYLPVEDPDKQRRFPAEGAVA